MTSKRLLPALAFLATGAIASGLALTSVPAQAAATHHGTPAPHAAPHPRGAVGKPLTRSQLAQARTKQVQMAAHGTMPTFSKAGSKTFTVNTTEDSDLANSAGTSCVDGDTGRCSLRAAVDAANNLNKPVRIVLGKHTYTLSLASQLEVANHHGTSIVGQGASKTAIAGDGTGLFYVDSDTGGPGSLSLTSLTLKNGTSLYGGAIQTADDIGVSLSLDHVVARNNTATSAGGALYAYGYVTLNISHSTFTGNHAPEGAVLYEYWSNIQIQDSSINGNSTTSGTTGYGGAIYTYYGVLDVTGGSISGNHAGDGSDSGYGGAVYDYGATTSLTGVHVDHNTANDDGEGGAIYAYEDLLSIDHGTLSHNKVVGTSSAGGGIYQYYYSQLSAEHVTMAGDRAGGESDFYGGGTIYSYAYEYSVQTNIDHSTITGSNASALYLIGYYGVSDASITNSTLSKNVSTFHNGYNDMGCGGAVCAYGYYYGTVHLDMQGNHVTGNGGVGDYSAGAVMQYGYEYSSSASTFTHNTFANNHSGANGYGGALGFFEASSDYSPISVHLNSNTFTGNRAGTQGSPGWGGAVSAYYYVTLADKGSHYSKNRAIGDGAVGGAVSYLGYVSATFTRSTFTGNSAGTNHAGNAGYGGAAYVSTESGTTFDQVTMSGNRSSEYGGGLYTDDYAYQVMITGSTFSGNTAGSSALDGYGGGIFTEDAVLTLENTTVTGNHADGAPGYGGGIFYEGAGAALAYSTVSGNTAKQGAGIYGETYGTVYGSILSDNKAPNHGPEKDCAVDNNAYKLVSYGGNVLGEKTCVVALQKSDKISKNPHLGKLKHNGGPTETMAISAKSPAVGRASYLVPSTDQRGHSRPSKHADAGAFELPKGK